MLYNRSQETTINVASADERYATACDAWAPVYYVSTRGLALHQLIKPIVKSVPIVDCVLSSHTLASAFSCQGR